MHGIFVDGFRPKSKKAVKEAVKRAVLYGGASVRLEATSLFGDEYDGDVFAAPAGIYTFVGPDPYTRRNFYGNIVVDADGRVSVR